MHKMYPTPPIVYGFTDLTLVHPLNHAGTRVRKTEGRGPDRDMVSAIIRYGLRFLFDPCYFNSSNTH